MEYKVLRKGAYFLSYFLEDFGVNTSIFDLSIQFWLLDMIPLLMVPLLNLELQVLALLVGLFQISLDFFLDFLSFFVGQKSLFDQLLLKNVCHIWMLGNLFVHERLCERWLIKFVVPKSSVADNINNHISFEFLSVLSGHHANFTYFFNVVGIDMENRGTLGSTDVSAVQAGSALDGVSCEPYLIVNYYVNGSSSLVIGQF